MSFPRLKMITMPKEIRSINLPTCRATPTEDARFRTLIEGLQFKGPSHFFRHCLDELFRIYDAGDVPELPVTIIRKQKPTQVKKPRK